MAYQDPDPLRDRDFTPRTDLRRDSGFNAMWGWIAGAVVLVLVLVFLFGGTQNTTTDINNSPAAPSITTPPANNTATAPRSSSPSETTVQSQQ